MEKREKEEWFAFVNKFKQIQTIKDRELLIQVYFNKKKKKLKTKFFFF